MWLLNTSTLVLHEFVGRNVPLYDILSHTWGNNEVSYHHFVSANAPRHLSSNGREVTASYLQPSWRGKTGNVAYGDESLQRLRESPADDSREMAINDGMMKVQIFCHLAARKGVEWVWMDTCCINKESSAELSEAINSMYRWYRQARNCWVYLADVKMRRYQSFSGETFPIEELMNVFCNARWFSRGWTLQELLAPANVSFYDQRWDFLGTKVSLASEISIATGIDKMMLCATDPTATLQKYSIAQRMAWASKRETTRIEDTAYSLLGIFGIHMSLLYGEGEYAFLRLQKKILKISTDETILAWDPYLLEGQHGDFHGILAPHPRVFTRAEDIVPLDMTSEPTSMTSLGAGFPIYNQQHLNRHTLRVVLPLNCRRNQEIVGIHLAKYGGTWYRVDDSVRLKQGLRSLGRNTTVPVSSFQGMFREALYVSTVPTPTPVTDNGIGLYRDLNINGDLNEEDIDTDAIDMGRDDMNPTYVAVRFGTHLIPWPAFARSLDPNVAARMQTSHPEIVQIRSELDLPVEMTDTGKEVVVHVPTPPQFVTPVRSWDWKNDTPELE